MAETFVYATLIESITEEQLLAASEGLPEWRKEYIRGKNLSGRIEGTFAYLLLMKLVSERFGLTDTARFTYGKYGKPYFSGINVFFSISHCKTAVAAAASLTEIGVDIMDNRPINEKIALRICSERELNKFNRVKDKQSFLMELWCKKESLVKKSGIGFNKGFISADTEKFDFYVFTAEKYTVSLAVEPCDTVLLSEIPFSELL